MKVRNFNILNWLFIMALIPAACGEEDDLKLIEPDHRVVYTSEMDFDNTVEINNSITFGDISPGVVERTWTFPEGVVDIVGSDSDITSNDDIVKAIFNVVGDHEVKLNQVFKGNVYVGTKNLNTKVIDTTIVVRVLSPISASIKAFSLNKDGSVGTELNMADNAENEITASRSVRFSFTSEGEPEVFDWTFEGGDPATIESADPVDVKYKRMGIYDVSFIASRQRPFGGDTIHFDNLIKVIPSTEPVDLEKVSDREGDIGLVFSREMDPTTLNPVNFEVSIENNGNVFSPVISKVTVDENEGNIVRIALVGEQIYNDDIIKVSYTPGSLSTLDGVQADGFTDQQLIFNKINILDTSSDYDYSFENSTASNWPYMWWGGIWGEYDLQISSAKAQHGSKSAYIEFRPNGGMIIGHTNTAGDQITFPVEAGKTYEIGLWVYVEDLGENDPAGFAPDIRFFWFPDTDWGVGGNPTFSSDFSTGKWVYSSTFVQFSASGDKTFQIRGYNEANPKRLKFYMDNLSVSLAKLRP
ncbi:hypothetical protein [Namhaeicola litoreus]|uniref:PKD domain-containing protein n=1 Tax=Namhaeicola litoreus TaxID=1052145 RepID=A0ABW3Y1Y9_9FLAO